MFQGPGDGLVHRGVFGIQPPHSGHLAVAGFHGGRSLLRDLPDMADERTPASDCSAARSSCSSPYSRNVSSIR